MRFFNLTIDQGGGLARKSIGNAFSDQRFSFSCKTESASTETKRPDREQLDAQLNRMSGQPFRWRLQAMHSNASLITALT